MCFTDTLSLSSPLTPLPLSLFLSFLSLSSLSLPSPLSLLSLSLSPPLPLQVAMWSRRAENFHQLCGQVNNMHSRLTGVPNRTLLYDLYQYAWDARETTMLLDSYIAWLGESVCVWTAIYVYM